MTGSWPDRMGSVGSAARRSVTMFRPGLTGALPALFEVCYAPAARSDSARFGMMWIACGRRWGISLILGSSPLLRNPPPPDLLIRDNRP